MNTIHNLLKLQVNLHFKNTSLCASPSTAKLNFNKVKQANVLTALVCIIKFSYWPAEGGLIHTLPFPVLAPTYTTGNRLTFNSAFLFGGGRAVTWGSLYSSRLNSIKVVYKLIIDE